MPNPFPGMNPYLEQPDYWSDFHNQSVAAIARNLVPKLLPKYRVVTDKWVVCRDGYADAGSRATGCEYAAAAWSIDTDQPNNQQPSSNLGASH
ncbi:MAG: DUF4058 family protein [Cyanobacteria bacterium P01_C01_bin.120]